MLIESSYFSGEIHIAQKGQSAVRNVIDAFIAKYEPQYLRKAMGESFSKLFMDGLLEDTINDRWTRLRDGDDYTDASGNTIHWDGLINSMMVSPIANYVYYWYARNNASVTTTSGEKEDTAQGSINVSAAGKQARAWNEMVKLNKELVCFLINKTGDDGNPLYPEFDENCVDCNVYQTINIYNL